MIPEFTEKGHLPVGSHKAKAAEFIEHFARGPGRQHLDDLVYGLIEYAREAHASSILFGGSFITNRAHPNDIDCVILFDRAELIPTVRPAISQGGGIADIYFASADYPDIVASFRKLFSVSKAGDNIGTIEIELGSRLSFDEFTEPNADFLELARLFYGRRHAVPASPRRKIIVPVHGIASRAEWYANVSLLGSMGGWTIAPFLYGFQDPTVFLKRKKRREIVDAFRDHLTDVCQLCESNTVSVIAHSFGTYIAMNYILGFDEPPTRYDTLILTGAIIDENLDFERLNYRVGHMLNEIAPNDEWVEWAKRANFGKDELFGKAGTVGFSRTSDRLVEYRTEIFTHTNVIKRDVIKSRWMPTLEANFGSVDRDRAWQK